MNILLQSYQHTYAYTHDAIKISLTIEAIEAATWIVAIFSFGIV